MKTYLLLLLGFLMAQYASAQDVITKTNGEELIVKVLEVTSQSVLYHAPDSVGGKRYSLPKFEIFMIRFANGTKEVFQEHLQFASENTQPVQDAERMYQLGQEHGRNYNKRDYRKMLRSNNVLGTTHTYLNDPNYIRGFEEEHGRRNLSKSVVGLSLIGGTLLFMLLIPAIL